MRPVLTVTPNPAVDISAAIEQMRPSVKLRLESPDMHPGGGGINVARIIARLGGSVQALAVLGGPQGRQVAVLLEEEGVPLLSFEVPANTRIALTVAERASGKEFRLQLPGAPWPTERTGELVAAIVEAVRVHDHPLVVLSGSLPEGMAPDFPTVLAKELARIGNEAGLVLDTSGAPLKLLMEGGAPPLALLRMNVAEAEDAAGTELPRPADSAAFAQMLATRGIARRVLIGHSSQGSVLATSRARLFCPAPNVTVGSLVGAGDSFLGAYLDAFARGRPAAVALATGVAGAAAAVQTPGTALCTPDDLQALLPRCHARPI